MPDKQDHEKVKEVALSPLKSVNSSTDFLWPDDFWQLDYIIQSEVREMMGENNYSDAAYKLAEYMIKQNHASLYQPGRMMGSKRNNKTSFFISTKQVLEKVHKTGFPSLTSEQKKVLYDYAATTSLARQGRRGKHTELAKTFRLYANFYAQIPEPKTAPTISYRGVSCCEKS